MNRRGFLGALLGVAAAPAIVKAENLMRIVTPRRRGEMSSIYMLDELAFLGMPKTSEDGIIVSESFLKKLNNNSVSGAHFNLYEKRAVELGNSRYPLNLYGSEHFHNPVYASDLAAKINAISKEQRSRRFF